MAAYNGFATEAGLANLYVFTDFIGKSTICGTTVTRGSDGGIVADICQPALYTAYQKHKPEAVMEQLNSDSDYIWRETDGSEFDQTMKEIVELARNLPTGKGSPLASPTSLVTRCRDDRELRDLGSIILEHCKRPTYIPVTKKFLDPLLMEDDTIDAEAFQFVHVIQMLKFAPGHFSQGVPRIYSSDRVYQRRYPTPNATQAGGKGLPAELERPFIDNTYSLEDLHRVATLFATTIHRRKQGSLNKFKPPTLTTASFKRHWDTRKNPKTASDGGGGTSLAFVARLSRFYGQQDQAITEAEASAREHGNPDHTKATSDSTDAAAAVLISMHKNSKPKFKKAPEPEQVTKDDFQWLFDTFALRYPNNTHEKLEAKFERVRETLTVFDDLVDQTKLSAYSGIIQQGIGEISDDDEATRMQQDLERAFALDQAMCESNAKYSPDYDGITNRFRLNDGFGSRKLSKILMDHQVAGRLSSSPPSVVWVALYSSRTDLEPLYDNLERLKCQILASEMGLGKTRLFGALIEVSARLCGSVENSSRDLNAQEEETEPRQADIRQMPGTNGDFRPSLIMCPPATVFQTWEEITTNFRRLKIHVYFARNESFRGGKTISERQLRWLLSTLDYSDPKACSSQYPLSSFWAN